MKIISHRSDAIDKTVVNKNMSQVKIFWMGGVGVESGQPRTVCFVIKRFVTVIS